MGKIISGIAHSHPWIVLGVGMLLAFVIGVGAGTEAPDAEPVADETQATELEEEEARLAQLAVELEAREREIEQAEQRLGKRVEREERARIEDGMWEVGVDVRPGTYRVLGGDRCSWSIFETLQRRHDSWIDGKFGGSNQTVQLDSDWWFETENCGTWETLD